ncbi:MAG: radical SAM protein [Elusimicrobia bacterium]|nr:radical SAM protein [Elusimicrobiota bacterium]
MQATRGCPHTCAFCSVSAFNGAAQRRRPAEEVAAEVAALPERFFLLVDDSLAAEPEYAKALFRALAPLRKHWVSQVTLKSTDDPELIRLAAESGCVGVFVGLETFSDRALESVDKGFNQVEEYRSRIRILHQNGIAVEAGVVLGFDADGPGVFAKTLRLLDELEIDMIQVSVLTPLPGTRFFKEMASRILDRNWAHYDYHHVVFQPRRMTAESLQAGHDWLTREFYQPWRILRRLWRQALRPLGARGLPYAAAVNFAYLGRILRWSIKGWDPAAEGGLPERRPAPQTPRLAQVC